MTISSPLDTSLTRAAAHLHAASYLAAQLLFENILSSHDERLDDLSAHRRSIGLTGAALKTPPTASLRSARPVSG